MFLLSGTGDMDLSTALWSFYSVHEQRVCNHGAWRCNVVHGLSLRCSIGLEQIIHASCQMQHMYRLSNSRTGELSRSVFGKACFKVIRCKAIQQHH
jgi:hypothetical protein